MGSQMEMTSIHHQPEQYSEEAVAHTSIMNSLDRRENYGDDDINAADNEDDDMGEDEPFDDGADFNNGTGMSSAVGEGAMMSYIDGNPSMIQRGCSANGEDTDPINTGVQASLQEIDSNKGGEQQKDTIEDGYE